MGRVAVPTMVLGIIASMIFPVPAFLMDFLLVANLILAFTLLLSALAASEPLKLSTLPSILLLATLYRLALNISTTRLILGTGDAGEVVEAFGSVVIGGSLFVGVVVFLVITLIQFVVIAKGSERVAEVSARFTLDALPGKQMSIDADVRAGLIDFETARMKRQELQAESRFYGALDGAMKFVKGDAVAGLVITAVNIIGGLVMGVAYEGLAFGDAAQKYTRLTVGDGLLSQIPALLNSVCAGLVVTRVSRGDGASLSDEMIEQLGQGRALQNFVGGSFIFLGCLPQIPFIPFAIFGIGMIALGCSSRDSSGVSRDEPKLPFLPRRVSPIAIQIGPGAAGKIEASGDMGRCIESLRERVFERTGLILGRIEFQIRNELADGYQVRIRGVHHHGSQSGVEGTPFASVSELMLDLEEIVLEHRVELIDDILTRRTLDMIEKESPELVSAVVPGILSITQLTGVIKELAREQVSIRDFDLVLQAVAEHGTKAPSEVMLAELVRGSLGWSILESCLGNDRVLRCAVLDPVLDLSLSKVARGDVVLNGAVLQEVIDKVSTCSNTYPLAVSRGTRRFLRDITLRHKSRYPLVAFEEIPREVNLSVVDTIRLSDQAKEETIIDALAA